MNNFRGFVLIGLRNAHIKMLCLSWHIPFHMEDFDCSKGWLRHPLDKWLSSEQLVLDSDLSHCWIWNCSYQVPSWSTEARLFGKTNFKFFEVVKNCNSVIFRRAKFW